MQAKAHWDSITDMSFCSSGNAFIFVHFICPLAIRYRYTMQFVYSCLLPFPAPTSLPPFPPTPGLFLNIQFFFFCNQCVSQGPSELSCGWNCQVEFSGAHWCVYKWRQWLTIQQLNRIEYEPMNTFWLHDWLMTGLVLCRPSASDIVRSQFSVTMSQPKEDSIS